MKIPKRWPRWAFLFVSLLTIPSQAEVERHIQVKPRELHLETAILRQNRPAARIVIPKGNAWYREQAERIVQAVEKRGGKIPIEEDTAFRDLSALKENLILLGNRDSNQAIRKLYYLHYTLLDARYPGPGGSELRSLHNPFGDGYNILFVGGMDREGVQRAVDWLVADIEAAPVSKGNLTLGYLQKIELGQGITPPENAKDARTWENSVGYGLGYFGWNLLSKNLALFYMTGNESYAKEFLRLTFPDKTIAQELADYDKEAYDDPMDPLGKPYHYQAIMMMLYWDLVEEHPFFTPEIRQRVTEKFAEQFYYHLKGTYKIMDRKEPQAILPGRHTTWEAMSAYVLGRYFKKYYPATDIETVLRRIQNIFDAFDKRFATEISTLYWENTFLEPAFMYAVLSDPLRYENNPVVRQYADTLAKISDRVPKNWAVTFASPAFYNLITSLTGDQAYADMVRDTGQDTSGFRVGQSYWPSKPYPQNAFKDAAGKIGAVRLDPAAMKRAPDFPAEKVIDLISWRQRPDAFGDFLLLDTKYQTGRVPVHNFSLITLRLDGNTVLRGYANQLDALRDGLPFQKTSWFSEVTRQLKLGDTLVIQARVGNQSGHQWQRTLLLRENQFLLALDEITALEDSKLSQIDVGWQPDSKVALTKESGGDFLLSPKEPSEGGGKDYTLSCSLPLESKIVPAQSTLGSDNKAAQFTLLRPLAKGEKLWLATALRPGKTLETPTAAQKGDTVALQLPHPAILQRNPDGGFLLIEAEHLLGVDVQSVPGFLTSDVPVSVDFNRQTGRLVIRNDSPKRPAKITGVPGHRQIVCPPGQTVTKEVPSAPMPAALADLLAQVPTLLASKPAESARLAKPEEGAPPLKQEWQFSGTPFIHQLLIADQGGSPLIVAADEKRVHLLTPQGELKRDIIASDTVGAIYWWAKERLLLVGTSDNFVRAYDLDGQEKWSYLTEMAEELIASQKFYWFKDASPGVFALQTLALPDGREVLFVGGAATVEILNAQGRLEKRFYQPVGDVDVLAPLPYQDGVPARMFCARSMGHWPFVYEISYENNSWTQRNMGEAMTVDKAGTDLGDFGFSMVGRNILFVERLTPDAPLTLIGDFNGAHNRLMQWSLDGKILQEVNLGPGFMAEGISKKNYGQSVLRDLNVRGIVTADFRGDGNRDVVLATNHQYLMSFDSQFTQKFLLRLSNIPITLHKISRADKNDLVAVGDTSGQILVVDGDGKVLGQATGEGTPTAMTHLGNTLIVGTSKGKITAFTLP